MGKPFAGRTLLGFDNIKQTFNSVWVSDNQTSMFVSERKADGSNKVITMEGKTNCPATGRRDIPMKTVLRVISPDKHLLEMFDGSKGITHGRLVRKLFRLFFRITARKDMAKPRYEPVLTHGFLKWNRGVTP